MRLSGRWFSRMACSILGGGGGEGAGGDSAERQRHTLSRQGCDIRFRVIRYRKDE